MIKALDDNRVVLQLTGTLDIFEAENLKAGAWQALSEREVQHLWVDLSQAQRLDATAVQVLLALRKSATEKGIEVTIDAGPDLNSVLQRAGIGL